MKNAILVDKLTAALTHHAEISGVAIGLRCACFVALLSVITGCQMMDMAKFSYANKTSNHEWRSEARVTTVPFKLVNNHIILPVRINGSEPLAFVLDSGAAATVITESHRSKLLHLNRGNSISLSGAGSGFESIAHIVKDTDVAIGDIRLLEQSVIHVPVAAMPFFDDLDEAYFDGIVGYDFFKRFVVEIDYDNLQLTFSEPMAFETNGLNLGDGWQELPLEIKSSMPYLTTRVKTSQGKPVSVKFLIDTGSTGSFSLIPSSHKEIEKPDLFYSTTSQGLTGDIVNLVAMTDYLAFGAYRLQNVAASYALSGEHSENGSNGNLGNEALNRMNLIFDYSNKRLWVKPNHRFAIPLAADRSGLRVTPHRLGGIIKQVAEGTGGESIGLQKGDIITRFNDRLVTESTFNELLRSLESEQHAVRLCWFSNSQSRCDNLKLTSRLKEHSHASKST